MKTKVSVLSFPIETNRMFTERKSTKHALNQLQATLLQMNIEERTAMMRRLDPKSLVQVQKYGRLQLEAQASAH